MNKPFINKKGLIDEGDGWCNSLEQHDYEMRESVIDECIKFIKEHSGEHYIDCDGYFGGQLELVFKVDDWIDDLEQLKEQK